MGFLVFLVVVFVFGLAVGALARLAVPGPDPMPIWATAALGIGGSIVGGIVARLLIGSYGGFLVALPGAGLLFILFPPLVPHPPLPRPGAPPAPPPPRSAPASTSEARTCERRATGRLRERHGAPIRWWWRATTLSEPSGASASSPAARRSWASRRPPDWCRQGRTELSPTTWSPGDR